MNTELITVLHKNKIEDNKLITVMHKLSKQEYQLPPDSRPYNNDGIKRSFSLLPGTFYEAMKFVTYPGVQPNTYLVTTSGTIFNASTHLPVDQTESNGYCGLRLYTIIGRSIPLFVHRIVAYEFCNPPMDYDSRIVNHIDGNKHNNYANNLEWITMAANNQHARELYSGVSSLGENGRKNITDEFVHSLCKEFVKGKSNTEIMKSTGMENNNANHTLLRDIRGGYTWIHITRQYTFDRSSKKHAYTLEEKDQITEYIRQGKRDIEIFVIMNKRPFISKQDTVTSEFKTISSLRQKEHKRLETLGQYKVKSKTTPTYTDEEIDIIKTLIKRGKSNAEIYYTITGKEYETKVDQYKRRYRNLNVIRSNLVGKYIE